MSARTWEEATQDVAVALPSWREGAELTLDEVLQDIEETLDDLRGGDFEKNEYGAFRYLAWLGAVGYVLEKWPLNENADAFVRACDAAVVDVLVLLPKKQKDYGCENILWGGVQGVVLRAHDKLARIKNLRARQAANVEKFSLVGVQNEPLTDSYFDLIGYGIVGAMLVKGTFQLPLEADLPKEAWVGTPNDLIAEAERRQLHTLEITVDEADASFDEEDIRAIVRDEMAKREKAKLHG